MPFEIIEDRIAYERNLQERIVLLNNGAYQGPELKEEWDYEPDPEDVFDPNAVLTNRKELVNITPSLFTEFAILIPDKEKQRHVPFSFEGRNYLRQIYDTPAKRTLIVAGRQVEKSTLLGNKLLSYACIVASLNALYVSPTNQQTKVFSQDRLKEPMETSDFLKSWTTSRLSDNVFLKKFVNRSQITLRYAYLNADRTRGIPADVIAVDELQDILTDNIPVIEECASHSPEHLKIFQYSGTPKSTDNTIEFYWMNYSTQNEWAVPCWRHTISTPAGITKVHWNILSEDNIGKKGLICDRCGNRISPKDDQARWVSLNPEVLKQLSKPYEGFRIPQIMVPWVTHEDILQKQQTYPRPKFYNEVLGRSYDAGTRPLTRQDVIDNCDSNYTLNESFLDRLRGQLAETTPVYAGIDWTGGGVNETSFTVLSLGAYIGNFYRIFFVHRFDGRESEPQLQIDIISQLIQKFRVNLIGCDYGGGFWPNDELIRRFGWQRVIKYQYSTPSAKVRWDDGLRRFLVNRTEVMSDVFNAIKRKDVFRFPSWDQFQVPYASDMLNIFSEYSEQRRINEYKKSPNCSDDTFHSLTFNFLASMIRHPRPDVIAPMGKDNN